MEAIVQEALTADTAEARRNAVDRAVDLVHEHTHDGLRDLLLHAADRFHDPGADRTLLKRLARLIMAAWRVEFATPAVLQPLVSAVAPLFDINSTPYEVYEMISDLAASLKLPLAAIPGYLDAIESKLALEEEEEEEAEPEPADVPGGSGAPGAAGGLGPVYAAMLMVRAVVTTGSEEDEGAGDEEEDEGGELLFVRNTGAQLLPLVRTALTSGPLRRRALVAAQLVGLASDLESHHPDCSAWIALWKDTLPPLLMAFGGVATEEEQAATRRPLTLLLTALASSVNGDMPLLSESATYDAFRAAVSSTVEVIMSEVATRRDFSINTAADAPPIASEEEATAVAMLAAAQSSLTHTFVQLCRRKGGEVFTATLRAFLRVFHFTARQQRDDPHWCDGVDRLFLTPEGDVPAHSPSRLVSDALMDLVDVVPRKSLMGTLTAVITPWLTASDDDAKHAAALAVFPAVAESLASDLFPMCRPLVSMIIPFVTSPHKHVAFGASRALAALLEEMATLPDGATSLPSTVVVTDIVKKRWLEAHGGTAGAPPLGKASCIQDATCDILVPALVAAIRPAAAGGAGGAAGAAAGAASAGADGSSGGAFAPFAAFSGQSIRSLHVSLNAIIRLNEDSADPAHIAGHEGSLLGALYALAANEALPVVLRHDALCATAAVGVLLGDRFKPFYAPFSRVIKALLLAHPTGSDLGGAASSSVRGGSARTLYMQGLQTLSILMETTMGLGEYTPPMPRTDAIEIPAAGVGAGALALVADEEDCGEGDVETIVDMCVDKLEECFERVKAKRQDRDKSPAVAITSDATFFLTGALRRSLHTLSPAGLAAKVPRVLSLMNEIVALPLFGDMAHAFEDAVEDAEGDSEDGDTNGVHDDHVNEYEEDLALWQAADSAAAADVIAARSKRKGEAADRNEPQVEVDTPYGPRTLTPDVEHFWVTSNTRRRYVDIVRLIGKACPGELAARAPACVTAIVASLSEPYSAFVNNFASTQGSECEACRAAPFIAKAVGTHLGSCTPEERASLGTTMEALVTTMSTSVVMTSDGTQLDPEVFEQRCDAFSSLVEWSAPLFSAFPATIAAIKTFARDQYGLIWRQIVMGLQSDVEGYLCDGMTKKEINTSGEMLERWAAYGPGLDYLSAVVEVALKAEGATDASTTLTYTMLLQNLVRAAVDALVPYSQACFEVLQANLNAIVSFVQFANFAFPPALVTGIASLLVKCAGFKSFPRLQQSAVFGLGIMARDKTAALAAVPVVASQALKAVQPHAKRMSATSSGIRAWVEENANIAQFRISLHMRDALGPAIADAALIDALSRMPLRYDIEEAADATAELAQYVLIKSSGHDASVLKAALGALARCIARDKRMAAGGELEAGAASGAAGDDGSDAEEEEEEEEEDADAEEGDDDDEEEDDGDEEGDEWEEEGTHLLPTKGDTVSPMTLQATAAAIMVALQAANTGDGAGSALAAHGAAVREALASLPAAEASVLREAVPSL